MPGAFEIVDGVGDDGRAEVVRARRRADGLPVVLKSARTADLGFTDALARLRRELEVLGAIDSPCVVRAHGVVVEGERAALVLEDFGGTSLAEQLRGRRLLLSEVIWVGACLARALDRVHAAGYLHKDVNPRNIVYNAATGEVKLIDFGVAGRPDARTGLVSVDALEGTLGYMAPEQTRRTNRDPDTRSDLYSMGVTLYELLTGRPPFAGSDPLTLVHAHLAVQPDPPERVEPSVPSVLSELVLKLMAKAPEERYQSAAGVEADLLECRRRLEVSGTIAAFALGEHDVTDRLQLPSTIDGRGPELALLRELLARTAEGVQLVVVTAPAGGGKTSLVHEFHDVVGEAASRFLEGRFDALWRNQPYRGFAEALDGLARRLLGESEERLEAWRRRIVAATAPHTQLLFQVVPALQGILGPQTAPAPLDPGPARQRLNETLVRLIEVIGSRERPLVLFLDDVQWSGPESVELLRLLAAPEQTAPVLVIIACRDGDLAPEERLGVTLAELERLGARVTRLPLAPLDGERTLALVAAALHRAPADVVQLAAAVFHKTRGNPFFMRQLLQTLHEEGHIVFDAEQREFRFDLPAIEAKRVSDNVIDLLAESIDHQSPATRHLLAVGAALGTRFEVEALAGVAELGLMATWEALLPALRLELVTPLGEVEYLEEDGSGVFLHRRLQFQHERIQQSAYALLRGDDRERTHLRIARRLRSASPAGEAELPGDRLFEIVAHFDHALPLLASVEERLEVATLNGVAAEQARRTGVPTVAIECFRCAAAIHGQDGRLNEYLEALLCCAESTYHAQRLDEAHQLLDEVAASSPSDRWLSRVDSLRSTLLVHAADFPAALACGRRAARRLGVELPVDAAAREARFEEAMGLISEAMGRRPVESWIDLPAMTDPDRVLLMTHLMDCIPAAFQSEPPVALLIFAEMVLLSLRHGNCGPSARAYTSFAIVLHAMGQERSAYKMGRLGYELNRRLGDTALSPSVQFVFGAFSCAAARPLSEAITMLRKAASAGREVGDWVHANNAAGVGTCYALFVGEPLAALREEAQAARARCLDSGDRATAPYVDRLIQLMRIYQGELPGDAPLSHDGRPDEPVAAELLASGNATQLYTLRLFGMERSYAFGDPATALRLARAALPLEASVPPMQSAIRRFYQGLAAAALWRDHPEDRPGLDLVMHECRERLARWAAQCPENFEAPLLLLDAERARLRDGSLEECLELFDRSIASAGRHGLRKVEAIANELAGRMWFERQRPQLGLVYLQRARGLYAEWGAEQKVRLLLAEFPAPAWMGGALRSGTTATESMPGGALDVHAISKAARAISGELVLPGLLQRMMEIIFENAGAQGGSLVLESEAGPTVAAWRAAGAERVSTESVSLATADFLPVSIVQYVLRSGESLVLDDATRDPRFAADPHVRAQRPRSVLCMPVRLQERSIGVVYLENTLLAGALSSARLDALTILVSQIAVSLENARLFAAQSQQAREILAINLELREQMADREEAEQALARYRDHLEELVEERTRELTGANTQLREAAEQREKMEAELRLAQKLESVGRLAAGVAHEINTPVQFVSDSVHFVRDAVRDMADVIAAWRSVGAAVEGAGEVAIVAAAARQAEEAADLEYALEQVPAALDRALDGLSRVAVIVRSMKEFAHPDRQDKSHVDLNQAIRTTLTIARNEYKYVADVVTDLGELPTAQCHAGEINQVLLNLIVNAAHAISDVVQGTERRGLITITTRLDGDAVVISVRDTGTGIPATIADRIFDPFFTTKEVGRGTGQGLAITRSVVVDKHGGSVRFETTPGCGTTFFLRLPLRPAGQAARDAA